MNFTIAELDHIYDALAIYVQELNTDLETGLHDGYPEDKAAAEKTVQELSAILTRIHEVIIPPEGA
jgi:hypothetical protein